MAHINLTPVRNSILKKGDLIKALENVPDDATIIVGMDPHEEEGQEDVASVVIYENLMNFLIISNE